MSPKISFNRYIMANSTPILIMDVSYGVRIQSKLLKQTLSKTKLLGLWVLAISKLMQTLFLKS